MAGGWGAQLWNRRHLERQAWRLLGGQRLFFAHLNASADVGGLVVGRDSARVCVCPCVCCCVPGRAALRVCPCPHIVLCAQDRVRLPVSELVSRCTRMSAWMCVCQRGKACSVCVGAGGSTGCGGGCCVCGCWLLCADMGGPGRVYTHVSEGTLCAHVCVCVCVDTGWV